MAHAIGEGHVGPDVDVHAHAPSASKDDSTTVSLGLNSVTLNGVTEKLIHE
jgi:hypothetical protein